MTFGKPRWAGLVIQDEQGNYITFQLKNPEGRIQSHVQMAPRPGAGYWSMFMDPEMRTVRYSILLEGEAGEWDGASKPGEAWDPLAIAQYPPLPLESE